MKGKRKVKDVHATALGEEMTDPAANGVRAVPRKKSRNELLPEQEDAELAARESAKILDLAREQQREADVDAAGGVAAEDRGALTNAISRLTHQAESDSDDEAGWDVDRTEFQDHDVVDIEASNLEVHDEQVFNAFLQRDTADEPKPTLLSSLVAAKLAAHEQQRAQALNAADPSASKAQMDPKLLQIYKEVGKLLARYTTGRLPKAFKLVPHLRNWEEVVFMMEPQNWSPHGTYAATKMFVSQLNVKQTQRFLNIVLLNKVRDDILQNKRLHFMLFQAVKKAVFKPGALYKGFVLPLLRKGDCTLREAVIISSVLSRTSIPVDHSAAALLKMAEMPYSGVTSFFMKTLLDKKYALPYLVVDALVDHFVSFRAEPRTLPVIWHLCLLTFVQRYKHSIRSERGKHVSGRPLLVYTAKQITTEHYAASDHESLRKLLRVQQHRGVTPEVIRELNHAAPRDSRVKQKQDSVSQGLSLAAAEDRFHMAPMVINDTGF